MVKELVNGARVLASTQIGAGKKSQGKTLKWHNF